MISFPPFFLLIPYGLLLAVMAFFALVDIVSLARFGARNWVGLLASFIFIAGAAFILYVTWNLLADVSWTTPMPLMSIPSVPAL